MRTCLACCGVAVGRTPKVLGHYIQELAAVRILKDRPLPRLAQEFASLAPALLREVATGVCVER